MAKWQNDLMLDAALDYVKTNSASIVLCNAQPVDYIEASTLISSGGVAIATAALVSADFIGGDGAGLADSVSGRKLIVPQKTDITVDETASATHVAVISGSALLYVTTCSSQSLTSGNLVTIPEWEIEMRDAV